MHKGNYYSKRIKINNFNADYLPIATNRQLISNLGALRPYAYALRLRCLVFTTLSGNENVIVFVKGAT